jgi:iron-sulfur cluster insertion protein
MTEILTLSDNAAKRILHLLGKEPAGSVLRLAVDGGGCSGFQYRYEFTTKIESDDNKIEKNGAVVIIDNTSKELLKDSELDFIENLSGEYFEVKNPHATARCGCGNSFSV